MVSKVPKTTGKKVSKKIILEPSHTLSPTISSVSLPAELPGMGMTEAEHKKMIEMIAIAQLQYNNIKQKIVKENRKELDALNAQIREFMGPYMLIGYDLNNNPVEIVSACDPAEHDALLERFRRVLFKINQNLAGSNGTDAYGLNN